jgi:hypothetical protein
MKTTKNTLVAALAIGSLWVANASAQTFYNSGDVLLGIQNGSGNNVIMDLGSYTTFTTASSAFTIDTTSLTAQLTAASIPLNNLRFSIFGYISSTPSDPLNNTLFATHFIGDTYWSGGAQNAQGIGASRIDGIGAGYNDFLSSGNAATVPATYLYSGDSSYTKGVTGANGSANLNYFPGSVEVSLTPAASVTAVDFLEIFPSTGSSPSSTQWKGFFSLSSSGVLTFDPVPEPSTFALMGMGALGLIALRRKNAKI